MSCYVIPLITIPGAAVLVTVEVWTFDALANVLSLLRGVGTIDLSF